MSLTASNPSNLEMNEFGRLTVTLHIGYGRLGRQSRFRQALKGTMTLFYKRLNLPAYGDDSSLSALTFIPPVILA